MTISSVGFQANSLQAIRAQNAFQKSIQQKQEVERTQQGFDKQDVIVSLSSRSLNNSEIQTTNQVQADNRKNPYISEIKQFVTQNNISDIEEDDIQHALKYGTSLFVDQMA